jgi:hypothetical protein
LKEFAMSNCVEFLPPRVLSENDELGKISNLTKPENNYLIDLILISKYERYIHPKMIMLATRLQRLLLKLTSFAKQNRATWILLAAGLVSSILVRSMDSVNNR